MKKTTVRRTASKRIPARSTSTRRRRLPTRARRRTPALATTVGTALGTLAVALVLGAGWPVRIALVGLVLALGAGYAVVRSRSRPSSPQAGTPAAPSADPSADQTQEPPA